MSATQIAMLIVAALLLLAFAGVVTVVVFLAKAFAHFSKAEARVNEILHGKKRS